MTRSTHASVCPHDCPSACALEVTTEDGRIVDVAGDRAHPFTRGVICGKVHDYAERVYSPLRVLRPMRRVGPKGAADFEPISWDEAIEEIAHRFTRVIAQWGPEAILPFSYAGTLGRVQYYAGHPFFNALGASQLDRTICVSTAYAGWRATVGRRGRERRRADGGGGARDPLGDQRRLHAHQPDDAGQGGALARGAHRLHRPLSHPDGPAGGRAPHDPLGDGRGAGARPDARPDPGGPSRPRLHRARDARLRGAPRARPRLPARARGGDHRASRGRDRRPRATVRRDAGQLSPGGHRAVAARERRHDVPDHRVPARAHGRLRPPARRGAARELRNASAPATRPSSGGTSCPRRRRAPSTWSSWGAP